VRERVLAIPQRKHVVHASTAIDTPGRRGGTRDTGQGKTIHGVGRARVIDEQNDQKLCGAARGDRIGEGGVGGGVVWGGGTGGDVKGVRQRKQLSRRQ